MELPPEPTLFIERKLQDLGPDHKELSTIFWVPVNIRETNKSLYEPRMVSIGPYYYGYPHLTAMEYHKWCFLRSFLHRNSKLCVEDCLKVLLSLESDAKECYEEKFELDKYYFIQMLLLDGCFILELFFKWIDDDPDLLIKDSWGLTMILSDLLLMDNQVPFFIIERLYDMVMGEWPYSTRDTFLSLLANFLANEELSQTCLERWPKKMNHLLDIYHHFLAVPEICREQAKDDLAANGWKERLIGSKSRANPKRLPHQIPGATELYEAGVKFKRKQSPKNLYDVQFMDGLLVLPRLLIDSNMKARLANLVALERYKTFGNRIATSYVALIDSLINTADDVALLQHAGVIRNKLSSHTEAAIFFNQLGDNMSLNAVNPRFVGIYKNIQLFYDSRWNHSLARLLQDYFHSPWAVISVIAGTILLGLSAVQTFFTVYPYYRPPSHR